MDNNLKNPSLPATSELQAAYTDLSKFLLLRSRAEIFENTAASKESQSADTEQQKNLAISTILSSDGAFFTKDFIARDVAKQLSLTPDSPENKGDLNIFGASTSDFGVNLKDKIGLTNTITAISSSFILAALKEEQVTLTKQINDLNDQKSHITGSSESDKSEKAVIDSQIEAIKKDVTENTTRQAAVNNSKTQNINLLYTGINSETQPAALKSPHVTLYRHVNRYLEPASTASEYCNVFFNAIDSINMSLCVPYFRLNIIDRFSKKKGRSSKLSLSAFLRQTTDPTGDKIFYNAEPILYNTASQVSKKLKSGKVISTETFFAPQTLLPDPTELLTSPRRLDTSVPLISLNSFSVSIESVGIALMSKKTADLSITLHDRSRLADISPLVTVGNFSSLYFEIEWGWIHPHGGPEFNNPVARFLNAMRFKEIFSPTTYNMNMADGGSMSINLRLIGGASLDVTNGAVLNGGFITRGYASSLLDKLLRADIEEVDGKSQATTEIRPITDILIDKSRTANLVSRDFVDKMWEYSTKDHRSDEDRKKLIKELTDVLNQSNYYKNEEIFEQLKKALKNVGVNGFDAAFDKINAKYKTQIAKQDFTSVSAYLTLLVGMPLASTGLYDEVQIHTFKFNESAGDLAGTQISDACVRIPDVLRRSDQPGALAGESSISTALALLANYLNNPKQPQYGIAEVSDYLTIKVDDVQKPAEDPSSKPDEKSKKTPEREFKVGPGFTTPNIRYIVRSVPAKIFDENAKSIADYQVNPERLIAQIIVYDGNASPNLEQVIEAYNYGKLKNTNPDNSPIPTNALTTDEAKMTFKRIAPSIIYGAVNSVLKSVNVSTDINNAIAQQQIIDEGKDLYLGQSKADESSDVNEISLFPGAVTISMIGLPIIERGQEIFLDLGTGTTLDALYYVSSVKHNFQPGDFTTNLTLIYKGQGTISSLKTILDNYNKTLAPNQKADTRPASPTSEPIITSTGLPQLGKTTGTIRTVGII